MGHFVVHFIINKGISSESDIEKKFCKLRTFYLLPVVDVWFEDVNQNAIKMANAIPAERTPNKRPMKNGNNGVQYFDNAELKQKSNMIMKLKRLLLYVVRFTFRFSVHFYY